MNLLESVHICKLYQTWRKIEGILEIIEYLFFMTNSITLAQKSPRDFRFLVISHLDLANGIIAVYCMIKFTTDNQLA